MTRGGVGLSGCLIMWGFAVAACAPGAGSSNASADFDAVGKSVEAGDTAAATTWQPGDAIPGWEDYDCPEREGAGYLEISLATPLYVGWGEITLLGHDDGTFAGQRFGGYFGDCSGTRCSTLSYGDVPEDSSWALLDLTNLDTSHSDRGEGLYDFARSGGAPFSIGTSMLTSWRAQGERAIDTAVTSVCIARSRPDGFRFEMEIRPVSPSSASDPFAAWYDHLVLRVTYVTTFPDHAGCYVDYSDPYACVAADFQSSVGYDNVSYDDAWPWDEITDPAIRDAVYERYTPWNTP